MVTIPAAWNDFREELLRHERGLCCIYLLMPRIVSAFGYNLRAWEEGTSGRALPCGGSDDGCRAPCKVGQPV